MGQSESVLKHLRVGFRDGKSNCILFTYKMFSHALLALCGVTGVLAQTTYSSPFLAQFLILSDFSVSTVGGVCDLTTEREMVLATNQPTD